MLCLWVIEVIGLLGRILKVKNLRRIIIVRLIVVLLSLMRM